jgi:hypothetical protein
METSCFYIGFFLLIFSNIIIVIVSLWTLFERFNKSGWASLVPVYNIIVILDIVKKPKWLVVFALVPIIHLVFWGVLMIWVSMYFKKSITFTLGLIFLLPLYLFYLAFYNNLPQNQEPITN